MYRPDADALSMRVATALEDTASDIPDDSGEWVPRHSGALL